MTTKDQIDNRRETRTPVGDEVEIAFDDFDTFRTEYAENISPSGMYLRTDEPRPVGSEFSFRLRIKDIGQKIRGRAKVVWTKEVANPTDGKATGMGLHFLEVDEQGASFLLEFIEKYGD